MNKKGKKRKSAVALGYEPESDLAPYVKAKGKGYIAEQIIEQAKEHDIPIQEDPSLVELLSQLEIHEAIPPDLYEVVDDVSFHVNRGEIIGIAGLMGAGRTETAMSIFGKSYGANIEGQLFIDEKEVELNSVPEAIEAGLAYVSEDRKDAGLNLMQTIKENISIASLDKISNNSVINEDVEKSYVEDYKELLTIKATSINQQVSSLSGGNQQKVSLGKWLLSDPEILFLDEPTRGVDVGAKFEIYNVINEIANQGKSIVVISSELPEIIGICDRIYTMSEGKFTGEVPKEEATQENLMELMTINITEGVS